MRIFKNPERMLGETYLRGEWTPEGCTLADLLRLLRQNVQPSITNLGPIGLLLGMLRSWNNLTTSLANVRHHYDQDEALFRSFLDQDMHYSCAFYKGQNESLEQAQRTKCEHIARKLNLQPGMSVLDIGCGWGSLALYLAETAGVKVTGITLSEEQLRVAMTRAKASPAAHRLTFRLQDYRHHQDVYDRVVSVGMFEHVGRSAYTGYFAAIERMLAEDGIALVHSIGSTAPPRPLNPWIGRHIFPGGYIPALSEVLPAVEHSGLVLSDLESLRGHYALTLKEWNRRFQLARPDWAALKGEEFCRLWEFYLVSCQIAFEVSSLVVFHLQLGKTNASVPQTRDYLYATRAQPPKAATRNGSIDQSATR